MTNTERVYLLNPGPVTLTERVRQAMLKPDLCHREPEFAAMQLDIKNRLANIYPEAKGQYEAILLTGSGTSGVEAMLSSILPKEGKTLLVTNGVYGERMASMVAAHGKPHAVVSAQWTDPIDLKATENYLNSHSEITHVVTVHHETTTGRLNNLKPLGELCKRKGVSLLIDSVSSFGAEEIQFEEWNVEAVAATANKCLHGVPGIAFVLVRKETLAEKASQSSTLYLDLFRYQKEQVKGYSPFTQAVQASYALQEAILELEEAGGWKARHQHYKNLSTLLISELEKLGISLLLNAAESSSMLTSFLLPEGMTYEKLHDHLKKSNFIIYAGQGNLQKTIFRIANMGDLTEADILRLSAIIKELLL